MQFITNAMSLILLSFVTGCEPQEERRKGSGKLLMKKKRTSTFTKLRVEKEIRVALTLDRKGPHDVIHEIATDDNLHDTIALNVNKDELYASLNVKRQIISKMGVGISSSVHGVDEVNIDYGGRVILKGASDSLVLTAKNKSGFSAPELKAQTFDVNLDSGARASVCVSGTVTGTIKNGSTLIVSCGGDYSGVVLKSNGSVREEKE